MKVTTGQFVALACALPAVTTAFTVVGTSKMSPILLQSSASPNGEVASGLEMFPVDPTFRRIEGEKSLVTYQMPPDAERAQYILKTDGRPLKAKVELWLGPIRRIHYMEIDNQDGNLAPFHATIKYKKDARPTLKISSNANLEFPLFAAVSVPTKERNDELNDISNKVWTTAPIKHKIQGGRVEGGGGAVRTVPVETHVQSVQVMFWSKDVGKKSFKARIELLQGPNNYKQLYNVQCGGGTQPYHCIFQTPGEGWTIRIYNKKFVEDGLFEFAIVPYATTEKRAPEMDAAPVMGGGGWWS
jgi:hypothetical protein